MFLHSGETNDRGELGVTSAFFFVPELRNSIHLQKTFMFSETYLQWSTLGGGGRGDSLQRAKKYTLASYFHIFSNQHLGYRTQDGVNKK